MIHSNHHQLNGMSFVLSVGWLKMVEGAVQLAVTVYRFEIEKKVALGQRERCPQRPLCRWATGVARETGCGSSGEVG